MESYDTNKKPEEYTLNTRPKQSMFLYFIVALYIFLMLYILIFKYVPISELFNTDRYLYRSYNLVPFKTISAYLNWGLSSTVPRTNILGNIIIFIPLGIFLQLFKKNKHLLRSLLMVVLISVGVEIFQYAFALGSLDIDDVILNSIGGFVGILLYKLIYLFLRDHGAMRTVVTIGIPLLGIFVFVLFFVL